MTEAVQIKLSALWLMLTYLPGDVCPRNPDGFCKNSKMFVGCH